jgi:hypothetical protein
MFSLITPHFVCYFYCPIPPVFLSANGKFPLLTHFIFPFSLSLSLFLSLLLRNLYPLPLNPYCFIGKGRIWSPPSCFSDFSRKGEIPLPLSSFSDSLRRGNVGKFPKLDSKLHYKSILRVILRFRKEKRRGRRRKNTFP